MTEHDPANLASAPAAERAAERTHGSSEDFEQEWAEALRTRHPRWFAYPDSGRDDQVALIEWVKARQVLRLLYRYGIEQGRTLEYGCGAAGISIYLKERGYQATVMDLSRNALRVAQLNDEAHRSVAEPLRALMGDAFAFPIANARFDVVMSYGLLEHFDREALRIVLAESVRVLKPGGVLLADIIPGGFNARAVGTFINYSGASLYYLLRRDFAARRELPRRHFDHYYETSFAPEVWADLLREQGLQDVQVQVCRPFPPLILRGGLESLYARGMRALMPFWERFDGSSSPLNRRWGWMYLAAGVRPPIPTG